MKIYLPAYLNELGGRSNNEDSIFSTSVSEENRLFIVCYGVGGQEKGEVASQMICESFNEYFVKNEIHIHNKFFLESGLKFVEEKLKRHVKLHPECNKMASTLTLLTLSVDTNEALVGWVGDSKIYHIRDGEILFESKDHSEIQSLIDMGEITKEEAENHPRKNIITRAINGTHPTRIDQHIIKDIKPNDFFLLCTDGILENLDTVKIKKWFTEENRPTDIRSIVIENAINKTKDNFSMYLVKIKSIGTKGKNTPVDLSTNKNENKKNNKYFNNYILAIVISVLICIIILFKGFIVERFSRADKEESTPIEKTIKIEKDEKSSANLNIEMNVEDKKTIEKEPQVEKQLLDNLPEEHQDSETYRLENAKEQ